MNLAKSFAIYEKTHASGNTGYRVDLGLVNGKRTFRSFPNRDAALKFREKCLSAQANRDPALLADITAVARHEILGALERLKPFNATIKDAVDFYLKHARPVKADASIGEVMAEFHRVKTKAGLSEKYLETSARCFFGPFRDHFRDCMITDVTAGAAEKYLYRHKSWNPTTRATHLRHLNVLFNFAVEKGYAALNPFAKIQRPKRQPNNSAEKVASVPQVIKLLQHALNNGYKDECAALVLVLFCGVRVEEVARLTWDKIKLDDEVPVVVLDMTKTGQRRINIIPDNALEWLKHLRKKGRVVPSNYEGRMRYLRKISKAGFQQNAARISFASYHVALYEDGAKTAYLLGHSNPILLYNTYRAIVTKEEARRYWKITPDYDGKDVIYTPTEQEVEKARKQGLAKGLAT